MSQADVYKLLKSRSPESLNIKQISEVLKVNECSIANNCNKLCLARLIKRKVYDIGKRWERDRFYVERIR